MAPMSFMRSSAGVAVLNNRLYVCGGRDGSSCHRSVECYDPHTNKWTLRSPMNYRRSGVGVGVLHGFLYALGGHDCPASDPRVCRTDTVERYDVATDTWTLVSTFKPNAVEILLYILLNTGILCALQIASLCIGRDSVGVALLGDNLFAVGGFDGHQYLKTVEKYDVDKNEWSEVSPLVFGRAAACVIAVPNFITSSPTPV